METRTFLLELHCEEIPARFLKPLTLDLNAGVASVFTWLPEGSSMPVDEFCSPRKIALRFSNLPAQQPDRSEVQIGPPQRLCVDEGGKPTLQGLKFAEKWGVDFSAVRFEQPAGKKEPCAVVTLTKQGRPTKELLAEALPGLIAGLHVPKAMRWGDSDFEFVRPIRSVLCLFGEEVVDFTVDGVKAGNITWGHRLYHRDHPEPILVKRPEDYEAALKTAGVVASFVERRTLLEEQMHRLAREAGGRVVEDPALLDLLAEIVECPAIIRGGFPRDFLQLPKEVLITSLKEHQKAFCIEDEQGRLLPYFLTAANRPDDPAGHVKAGNEWVLRARLYDARFFFAEDRKHPLESRLESLKHLTFQAMLGSYFEKAERVSALAGKLAQILALDAELARRAGRLAKADLRTLMVGEFPELQGIMGGEYLRLEGAPEAVWKAVKEHYRPAGAEDALPETPEGCLLSMADKLDTVCGCFKAGMIPTGSKDPLALRRAGQGIVRILWETGWKLNLTDACRSAYDQVSLRGNAVAVLPPKEQPEGSPLRKAEHDEDTFEPLLPFFRDRVAYQLELAGYAGSVRRSALATGWADLVDLKARCEALSAFAEDARFASLAQSAKRIANILKDEAPAETFDAAVLQDATEKALADRLKMLETTKDHAVLLAALADLAEPLEAFFTAVMVKCEDPKLRAARLSLLHRLRQAFLRVADFGVWQ